jgi:membrane protein required for colicin V production
MVWVDYVILGIILVSVLVGVWRGFVKEALSLVAWLVGFWVALAHWQGAAAWLGRYVDSGGAAAVLAFAGLLVAVLLVGALINHFVAKGIEAAGLKPADRALGAAFGVVRGAALVAVLLLFSGLLHADGSAAWRRSQLVPYFGPLVTWLRGYLDDHPDFSGRGG